MTELKINAAPPRDAASRPSVLGASIKTIYERVAGSTDYKRNENSLRLIQISVVTVSAVATGFVNAFAHQERLGTVLALLLAMSIAGFVEKFFFTLRHGLTTVYKAGKQRLFAQMSYRVIQLTMILNVAVLTAWIVGAKLPPFLQFWYQWSLVVHFGLALVGVTAVRDSDAVVENRMLELKAETARQDIVTVRKAAAIGNPMVLVAAKLRGVMDAMGLAWRLMGRKSPTSSSDYLDQVDEVARTRYDHIDGRSGLAWLNEGQEQERPIYPN